MSDFKPRGALLNCFITFPQFRTDLPVLITEGYVTITGPETCKWNKIATSLAEYFKWIGRYTEWVPGGFWSPVAKTFGKKQRRLSGPVSNNATPIKPDKLWIYDSKKSFYLPSGTRNRRQERKSLYNKPQIDDKSLHKLYLK